MDRQVGQKVGEKMAGSEVLCPYYVWSEGGRILNTFSS